MNTQQHKIPVPSEPTYLKDKIRVGSRVTSHRFTGTGSVKNLNGSGLAMVEHGSPAVEDLLRVSYLTRVPCHTHQDQVVFVPVEMSPTEDAYPCTIHGLVDLGMQPVPTFIGEEPLTVHRLLIIFRCFDKVLVKQAQREEDGFVDAHYTLGYNPNKKSDLYGLMCDIAPESVWEEEHTIYNQKTDEIVSREMVGAISIENLLGKPVLVNFKSRPCKYLAVSNIRAGTEENPLSLKSLPFFYNLSTGQHHIGKMGIEILKILMRRYGAQLQSSVSQEVLA